MKIKEVTYILYNLIKEFRIYKGTNSDDYMVCVLIDDENSFNSDVFNTINNCYDWINQNS